MSPPLPFGPYLLLDRIAVGGMAEVFVAARSDKPGRLWALKRILPGLVEEREFVAMFVDEARIAAQVRHPNVSRTDDLGRQDGIHFIAMEYVSGVDLRTALERTKTKGPLPIPVVLRLMAQVCAGLDAAHRKTGATGQSLGIIHRDVSPQNVLVSFTGDVKLIDFGVAKAADRLQRTEVGVLKGKFAYMSPEQTRGADIDRRSDVFACGVLLYELLTGQRPFAGDSDFETLRLIREGQFRPVRELRPELSPALEAAVSGALAVDREQRLAWCSELQSLLQQELSRTSSGPDELRLWVQTALPEEVAREEQRVERWRRVAEGRPPAMERPVAPPRRPDPTPVAPVPTTDKLSLAPPLPVDGTAVMDLSTQATQAVSLASLGIAPAPPTRPARQVETAIGPAPSAPERTSITAVPARPVTRASPPRTGDPASPPAKPKSARIAIAALAVVVAVVFGVGAWRKLHPPAPAADTVEAAEVDAAVEAPAATPSAPQPPVPAVAPAPTGDSKTAGAPRADPPAVSPSVAKAPPPVPAPSKTQARPAAEKPVTVKAEAKEAPKPTTSSTVEPRVRPATTTTTPPPVKREVTPPPEEPKAPAAKGRLVANCQPSGTLIVDGKSTGRTTPITKGNALELVAGRHMVACDIDGTRTDPKPVDIVSDETAKFVDRLP